MADNKDWSQESLLSSVKADALVSVSFDESEEVYTIPRSVLYNASIWFRKALAPNRFKEGKAMAIKLSEANPIIFGHLVYWLYNRDVRAIDRTSSESQAASTLGLVQLWIVGDAYFLPGLQNQAMSLLHHFASKQTQWIGTDAVREGLTRAPNTRLFDFLVAVVIFYLRFQPSGYAPTKTVYFSRSDFESLGMIPGFMSSFYDQVSGPISSHSIFKNQANRNEALEVGKLPSFLVAVDK